MRLRRSITLPLFAVAAGAITVGGLDTTRRICAAGAAGVQNTVATQGAAAPMTPATTPARQPVVRVVQPVGESTYDQPSLEQPAPRPTIAPPASIMHARVNPALLVPDAPPQVPNAPVVRAATPPSMSDLSSAESSESQYQEIAEPVEPQAPAANSSLVVGPRTPPQGGDPASEQFSSRELFGPPPMVSRDIEPRATHWPANTLPRRQAPPPVTENSVVRIKPAQPASSADKGSLFVDGSKKEDATPHADVVTSGPPRVSFTQPPLVEPAPVVALPAPLRSAPSAAADVTAGPAAVLNERRTAAAPLPVGPRVGPAPVATPSVAASPAAPQTDVALRPSVPSPSPVPRDPTVKLAPSMLPPQPLPTNGAAPPRPMPAPQNVAVEGPRTAPQRPGVPYGPMAPHQLPLAGAPPVHAPYMMVVARRGQEHIDYGFNLAERGASFSAEAEFNEALLLVAQAIDAAEQTHAHSDAMAIGLRAFREADDFVPRDGVEPKIASVVAMHQTPVLKNVDTRRMPLLVAMQEYYSYAQFHLAVAGGHEPTAAAALYGLARLQSVLGNGNDMKKMMCGPKAIALHQAALVVDPMNYAAANELGVLLSRYGQWSEAQAAFMHSVVVSPRPENWKNLATSYDALGDKMAAQDAWKHFEVARRERGTGSAGGGDRPTVRMVDTETFVRDSSRSESSELVINNDSEVGPIQASAAMPGQPPVQQNAVAQQVKAEEPKSSDGQPLNWLKSKMSAAFGKDRQAGKEQPQRR